MWLINEEQKIVRKISRRVQECCRLAVEINAGNNFPLRDNSRLRAAFPDHSLCVFYRELQYFILFFSSLRRSCNSCFMLSRARIVYHAKSRSVWRENIDGFACPIISPLGGRFARCDRLYLQRIRCAMRYPHRQVVFECVSRTRNLPRLKSISLRCIAYLPSLSTLARGSHPFSSNKTAVFFRPQPYIQKRSHYQSIATG